MGARYFGVDIGDRNSIRLRRAFVLIAVNEVSSHQIGQYKILKSHEKKFLVLNFTFESSLA